MITTVAVLIGTSVLAVVGVFCTLWPVADDDEEESQRCVTGRVAGAVTLKS